MADDVPKPPQTPEEIAAYNEMRGMPNGILFDPETGDVIHDAYAEATGKPGFKNRAEFEAAQAKLDLALAEYRAKHSKVAP